MTPLIHFITSGAVCTPTRALSVCLSVCLSEAPDTCLTACFNIKTFDLGVSQLWLCVFLLRSIGYKNPLIKPNLLLHTCFPRAIRKNIFFCW